LLENYIAQNEKPDVFVISPFNSVANNFRNHLKSRNQDFARKMQGRIGTIHKFQGREAGLVVLILGCDQSRIGAVRWACQSPNILNVAVTRAQQAVIVIGDQDLWGRHAHFDVLLEELGS
jgi:superfamily I DNA and/or RNA helicase